jgi:hypothetical protein
MTDWHSFCTPFPLGHVVPYKEVEEEMNLSDSQQMAMLEIGEHSESTGYIPPHLLLGLLAQELICERGPGSVNFTSAGRLVYKDLVASAVEPGSDLSEHKTYRVVGVNADRSRVILDEGLTKPRAEQARRMLLGADSYPTVKIEPE